MSKTYRRNSYYKPKKYGKVFDKKSKKWTSKKDKPTPILDTATFLPDFDIDPEDVRL